MLSATRRENRFKSWVELSIPITAGWFTALAQIALINYVRFWLTGTWGGFSL